MMNDEQLNLEKNFPKASSKRRTFQSINTVQQQENHCTKLLAMCSAVPRYVTFTLASEMVKLYREI